MEIDGFIVCVVSLNGLFNSLGRTDRLPGSLGSRVFGSLGSGDGLPWGLLVLFYV